MSPRISKLEALLARIQGNAKKPREFAPTTLTVPPTPDAKAALAQEQHDEPPPPTRKPIEVEAPLESRARLVAAPEAEETEELDAEDVMVLDDRHVVTQETLIDANAPTQEQQAVIEIEEPPPSSRRPIAEPAETPQEAELPVAPPPTHTPPPESGKQVASSDALSFDDDFTGVRETTAKVELPKPEPSIQLQSLRSPPVVTPAAKDDLEAELPSPEPPEEPTRPPPGPVIPSAPEVTRPTRPVAASNVADVPRSVPVPSPKTFGDLLDLTLSL